MRFTYEDKEYEIVDPNKWTTLEAAQLQRYTEMHPVDLWRDFTVGGPFGVHSVVWITLRRSGVDIGWGDLELPMFETVRSIKSSDVPPEPPDPSSASTRRRSAGSARPRSSAASKKSSASTSS